MDHKDYFYTGKILKPHGIHGALVIKIEVDFFDLLFDTIDYFFFEIDGLLIPFFISELTFNNQDTASAIFEFIPNEIEGKKYIGTSLYLPNDLLPDNLVELSKFDHLEGYRVIDKNFGLLGTIKAVLHYSMNTVFQIYKDSKEVLIPATDAIVTNINEVSKEITIQAPDGLIDIYLGEGNLEEE